MKLPFKSFGSVVKCIRFYYPSFRIINRTLDVNSSICSLTFNKEFDSLKKAFLSKVFKGRLNSFYFEYSYLTESFSKLVIHLKY